MASTLGVFRSALQSRAELAADADAIARKTAERVSQSVELNRSLAEVVGAAANGDFSRRVDIGFDDDDPGRVRIWQRSPEYGVHHAERGGVHPDAERDGHDDDERISGRSPEDSGAVSEVAHCGSEGGPDADVPNALLDLLYASNLNEGGTLRVGGSEAPSFV